MNKGQERKLKLDKLQKEAEAEDRIIFDAVNTRQGKDLMKLFRRLFYDRPSYVDGNPHKTSFREGQRDVVGMMIEAQNRIEGVDNVESIELDE